MSHIKITRNLVNVVVYGCNKPAHPPGRQEKTGPEKTFSSGSISLYIRG
jgi:hypothetical protein